MKIFNIRIIKNYNEDESIDEINILVSFYQIYKLEIMSILQKLKDIFQKTFQQTNDHSDDFLVEENYFLKIYDDYEFLVNEIDTKIIPWLGQTGFVFIKNPHFEKFVKRNKTIWFSTENVN